MRRFARVAALFTAARASAPCSSSRSVAGNPSAVRSTSSSSMRSPNAGRPPFPLNATIRITHSFRTRAKQNGSRRLLLVEDEIVRNRGPPDVERILRRMIGGGPFHVGRHEIDAVRVFGPAAPGVLDVVEIVGPEHVAADAPAFRISLRLHELGAQPDIVEA